MRKYVLGLALVLIFSEASQAQIAFDTASSGEVINGTSVSYNHTVNGTNTLLVVGVHVLSASDLVNAPTYNGTALTLIDKVFISGGSRWVYHFALAGATQGTHTLTVTTSAAVSFAVVAASYSGVLGLPVDNSAKRWDVGGAAPISSTTTLTPNSANTWTILVGATTNAPIGSGSGSTLRVKSGQFGSGSPFDRIGIFDSNGPINPAQSTSMTITGDGSYGEFGTVMASYAVAQTTSTSLPLLYNTSLSYIGGFRVPDSCSTDDFGFGGRVIAFRPGSGSQSPSLFISSKQSNVAEISIPTPVNDSTASNMPQAECIKSFVEPTDGLRSQGNVPGTDSSQHAFPTGMVVVNGKLWINNGVYYDADAQQTVSLLSRPLDLSVSNQSSGLYGFTSSLSGYSNSVATKSVAAISSDWASAMGGDIFLSKFNTSIISSQSYGPDAIVVDTTTLSSTTQGQQYSAANTPLFYPGSHPMTDDPNDPTDNGARIGKVYSYFSQANFDGSLVQPKGTSTLLVFQVAGATRGTSAGGYGYGYGCGCDQQTTPGSSSCPGHTSDPACVEGYYYDPERSTDKGHHGYPYVYQVLAYDMNDLVAAQANGPTYPWNLRPYTYWELPLMPFNLPSGLTAETRLSNATYDPVQNRIYIAQMNCCDAHGLDPKPVIHVFQVNP